MAGTDMRGIKRRIKSVTSIEHITNAMKLVSAAKLRRAKNTFEKEHDVLHLISANIDKLCSHAEELPKRYLAGSREIQRTCYIVVTGNRGLAGSYNTSVIKAADREIFMPKGTYENSKVLPPLMVCIGNKGYSYFAKRGFEIFAEFHEPLESISFTETAAVYRPVLELYDRGEIDEIVMVYTSFVTTMEQSVTVERLLPFEPKPAESLGGNDTGNHKRLLEYEPDAKEVFNYLVPKYAEIMMHRALMESATCEHAARRMAMQNATDNAREMIDNLTLNYNRARQAAITSEITEIVSGADAIK